MARARRSIGAGSPLHLLIVSNTGASSHIYGADRDWVNLLNALGPELVRVTWVGVSGTELLREYFDERMTARFLDIEFLPFVELFQDAQHRRRTPRNWAGLALAYGRSLLPALRQLRRALREDPPEVVVTNTSVVLLGAVYARLARLPHVWSVKEYLDPRVTDCRRFARLMERMSDAVVLPSKSIAGAFSSRARVLRDGSDVAAVRAGARGADRERVLRSLGLPPELPVVAQVGILAESKGQQHTAEAYVRLAKSGASPFSLLFLGMVTREFRDRLDSIFAGVPDEWRGRVGFSEFGPGDFSYLSSSDVVVHPSVIPDTYPNAVREALILGKPVIGTRSGGIPELVTDGETGILVGVGDVEALARALGRLTGSPSERERMGAAAWRFAEEKIDVRVCKKAFQDLLLGLRRGGAGEPAVMALEAK